MGNYFKLALGIVLLAWMTAWTRADDLRPQPTAEFLPKTSALIPSEVFRHLKEDGFVMVRPGWVLRAGRIGAEGVLHDVTIVKFRDRKEWTMRAKRGKIDWISGTCILLLAEGTVTADGCGCEFGKLQYALTGE